MQLLDYAARFELEAMRKVEGWSAASPVKPQDAVVDALALFHLAAELRAKHERDG